MIEITEILKANLSFLLGYFLGIISGVVFLALFLILFWALPSLKEKFRLARFWLKYKKEIEEDKK